jgi:putative ABC transport system permease protein
VNPLPLIAIALGSLRRNVVRAMLTMLGVIIGVASVVMMVAVGLGAQAEIQRGIDGLGTNLVVIVPGPTTQGGVSQGAGSAPALSADDADVLRRESSLFVGVSPVVVAPTRVVVGAINWRTSVYGVSPDYPLIRSWTLASGRSFDEEEARAARKVAVLGHTVATTLFPDEDPVGRSLRVRGVPMEIIGVLARKGPTPDGTDQDDVILAPLETVQTRLAGRQYLTQVLGSTASKADVADAMVEARAILRQAHGLAAHEPDDVQIRDQAALAETAQETTRVMTMLLAAVASVSLLVGGIGIMNIMLVSVTERTREIGIRRAVGARRSDVLTQFLVEAIVLSGLGGVLGVGLGVFGAWALGEATGWATQVTPLTVGVALGFSAGVGVFFGFYPARRAANLDVIEALRFQ